MCFALIRITGIKLMVRAETSPTGMSCMSVLLADEIKFYVSARRQFIQYFCAVNSSRLPRIQSNLENLLIFLSLWFFFAFS